MGFIYSYFIGYDSDFVWFRYIMFFDVNIYTVSTLNQCVNMHETVT